MICYQIETGGFAFCSRFLLITEKLLQMFPFNNPDITYNIYSIAFKQIRMLGT